MDNERTTSIETYTGRFIDPFQPPGDFHLVDIAHALSNLCRFNGHAKRFYSVAQHSVHVAQLVRRLGGGQVDVAHALLHDAAEAYMGDVPRPIKRDDFKAAEQRLLDAIYSWAGLPTIVSPTVQLADDALLYMEARIVLRTGGVSWRGSLVQDARRRGKSLPLRAAAGLPLWPPLQPTQAKRRFLQQAGWLFPPKSAN